MNKVALSIFLIIVTAARAVDEVSSIPSFVINGGEDITSVNTGIQYTATKGEAEYSCIPTTAYWPYTDTKGMTIKKACSITGCSSSPRDGVFCVAEPPGDPTYYSTLSAKMEVKEIPVLDCSIKQISPGLVKYKEYDGSWVPLNGLVNMGATAINKPEEHVFLLQQDGRRILGGTPYLSKAEALNKLADYIDPGEMGCTSVSNNSLKVHKCNNSGNNCTLMDTLPASTTSWMWDMDWDHSVTFTYQNLSLISDTTWTITYFKMCWWAIKEDGTRLESGSCPSGYFHKTGRDNAEITLKKGFYKEFVIRIHEGVVVRKETGIKNISPPIPDTANYGRGTDENVNQGQVLLRAPDLGIRYSVDNTSGKATTSVDYLYEIREDFIPLQQYFCKKTRVVNSKEELFIDLCDVTSDYEEFVSKTISATKYSTSRDPMRSMALELASIPIKASSNNEEEQGGGEEEEVTQIDYLSAIRECAMISYDKAGDASFFKECLINMGVSSSMANSIASHYIFSDSLTDGTCRWIASDGRIYYFQFNEEAFPKHIDTEKLATVGRCIYGELQCYGIAPYSVNWCPDGNIIHEEFTDTTVDDRATLGDWTLGDMRTAILSLSEKCPSDWEYGGWIDECEPTLSTLYTVLWLLGAVLILAGIVTLMCYCKHCCCFSYRSKMKRAQKKKLKRLQYERMLDKWEKEQQQLSPEGIQPQTNTAPITAVGGAQSPPINKAAPQTVNTNPESMHQLQVVRSYIPIEDEW